MGSKVHKYEGKSIEVSYDVKRCIHMAECAGGLHSVFNPKAKPWVAPDNAAADKVAEVIMRCPTGALKFVRKDGGAEETAPARNVVTIDPDGCIFIRGDIQIVTADDESVVNDTRVALCRCGASANKPFCDGSHTDAAFTDPGNLGTIGIAVDQLPDAAEPLKVTLRKNGPLFLQGPLEIHSADGSATLLLKRCSLCRCGASANKPFCDGSHKRIEFKSE